MHSSRPPSLGHLRTQEHSDCNGKGSPSTLGPTQVSLEDNTEDENAEEEVVLVSLGACLLALLLQKYPKYLSDYGQKSRIVPRVWNQD